MQQHPWFGHRCHTTHACGSARGSRHRHRAMRAGESSSPCTSCSLPCPLAPKTLTAVVIQRSYRTHVAPCDAVCAGESPGRNPSSYTSASPAPYTTDRTSSCCPKTSQKGSGIQPPCCSSKQSPSTPPFVLLSPTHPDDLPVAVQPCRVVRPGGGAARQRVRRLGRRDATWCGGGGGEGGEDGQEGKTHGSIGIGSTAQGVPCAGGGCRGHGNPTCGQVTCNAEVQWPYAQSADAWCVTCSNCAAQVR